MLVAQRIQLNPNNKQTTFFNKSAGCSRFAYNWAKNEWDKRYNDNKKVNEALLRKELNSIKREVFPWMLEVPKTVIQQSIKDLGVAYQNAFRRINKKQRTSNDKNPFGFPVYKKKFKNDSFRIDNGPLVKGEHSVVVNNKKVKVPKLGYVRLTERVRFTGQIKSAVISRKANKWFVSFLIDTNDIVRTKKKRNVVGVDLGVNKLATLSNKKIFVGPKAYTCRMRKLRKLNKKFSRTKKLSKNRKKAAQALATLHYRISCIRKDSIHKLTSHLSKDYRIISIEDLNVSGMIKNHNLARAISDMGFGEFRRQMEYKTAWYGSTLFIADRFYPSTKTCSKCDNIQNMDGKDTYHCESCGYKIERDLNASINLENLAVSFIDKQNDCGEKSAGLTSVN